MTKQFGSALRKGYQKSKKQTLYIQYITWHTFTAQSLYYIKMKSLSKK